MMRALAACALACALTACAPRAARCDLSASREVAFSRMGNADTITARSFGASCDKAIGVIEIVDAEGFPLWAWASPMARAFGDGLHTDEPEQMQAFLERWTQAPVATTAAAPAWEALAPGQTTLNQFTYNDIRARDLPMLCHFSATGRQTCVFWEPAAGGAGHLLDRDAEEIE